MLPELGRLASVSVEVLPSPGPALTIGSKQLPPTTAVIPDRWKQSLAHALLSAPIRPRILLRHTGKNLKRNWSGSIFHMTSRCIQPHTTPFLTIRGPDIMQRQHRILGGEC